MREGVLRFWFEEHGPGQWWAKSPDFDRLIARRFAALHARAARCELSEWRTTASGRLAEIIVLDQFSRHLYRDRPEAFAHDSLALALAQEAISAGDDRELVMQHRNFLYMPFTHSESAVIHEVALRLFSRNGDDETLRFERRHRDIILRFGRYPHRNAILGRPSTPEEAAFLRQPGSSF